MIRIITIFLILIVTTTLPAETLTVMTWNIRVGVGPGESLKGDALKENLQAIADVISDSGADIVLLQEVDRGSKRTDNLDQLTILGKATGMHSHWVPAIENEDMKYGIGMLSRWPISEGSGLILPKVEYTNPDIPEWYSEQRMGMIVHIDELDIPLAVINTHLGLTKEQRVDQIAQLAYLASKQKREGRWVLFGGDLNAEPDGTELLPVRNILRDVYQNHTDKYGLTADMPISQRLTFPATNPDRCIDYLFVDRDAFQVESVAVLDKPLSDHLPVVAELSYEPPASPEE